MQNKLKTSEKNKLKVPEKKYYIIELEALIPAIIKYRVLAEDEEKALQQINWFTPSEPPKYKLNALKKIQAKIYLFGTAMLQFVKKF
jgi:hypothetical protein